MATPLRTSDDACRNGLPACLLSGVRAIVTSTAVQVVPSVARCLRPNGRFCGFSPCIEQVQRTAEALREHAFTDIQCVECLLRFYDVKSEPSLTPVMPFEGGLSAGGRGDQAPQAEDEAGMGKKRGRDRDCLLYTSPSPRD